MKDGYLLCLIIQFGMEVTEIQFKKAAFESRAAKCLNAKFHINELTGKLTHQLCSSPQYSGTSHTQVTSKNYQQQSGSVAKWIFLRTPGDT